MTFYARKGALPRQHSTAVVGLPAVIWLDLQLQGAPAIRYSGLFRQLLGTGAAAIGIQEVGQQFGKTSLMRQLAEHFPLRSRDPPKSQTLELKGIESGGVSATAALYKDRNLDATSSPSGI